MSNPGPAITSTSLLTQENVPQQDGHQVGPAATSLVGFWGTTPIVQPAATAGNTHTPTAGAGTSVKVDTTFDGTLGTKAYTIGDIVIALKTAGLLAT